MLIYTSVPRKKAKRKSTKVVPKAPRVRKLQAKLVKEPRYRAPGLEHYPSKIDEYLATTDPKAPLPDKYEGDMAAREAAAQVEIKRKAQCVAPAFNKGPYTYIATEEQAKWVGRK